jgi:hypothetical protein
VSEAAAFAFALATTGGEGTADPETAVANELEAEAEVGGGLFFEKSTMFPFLSVMVKTLFSRTAFCKLLPPFEAPGLILLLLLL